jgi:hypothetical protein
LKNYLHTLFFALIIFSSPLSKADTTFQLNWTSSGSASATGQITLNSTGLSYLTSPHVGPTASTPNIAGITGFSITVSGSGSGNGTFTLQLGDSFALWTPSTLDLTRNLVGQIISPGPGNWGDSASTQGDFRYFPISCGSGSVAPQGLGYFTLKTNCGFGEILLLSSFIDISLLSSSPLAADTQSSLTRLTSGLRGTYNTASLISNFSNSNTYDCNLFDVKGMCISAGGRYSTVDNPSSNSSAAVVTLGYKVSPSIRIGGFLDQSVNNNAPTGINLSNKNPMMGAFLYWNQNADGLGYQVKLANAYQDKDLTTTRDVIGSSEAGRGTTSLNSRSYVGELSNAFMFKENTLVRPYFALRYTTVEQNAYTETGVDNPLTYGALNNRTTSALMGVKFKHALTPKANLIGSLGVEQDLHNKTDRLTATGIAGLTSENLSSDLHRTRPVASIGATYDIAKTQRLSGEVLVQQLPFQSTTGATAYFNYMIGF